MRKWRGCAKRCSLCSAPGPGGGCMSFKHPTLYLDHVLINSSGVHYNLATVSLENVVEEWNRMNCITLHRPHFVFISFKWCIHLNMNSALHHHCSVLQFLDNLLLLHIHNLNSLIYSYIWFPFDLRDKVNPTRSTLTITITLNQSGNLRTN